MKIESEICKICPINNTCDPNLIPQHAKGKKLRTNNPWNCRHIACLKGRDGAIKEKQNLNKKKIFSGYAYFKSTDKPSVRRFDMLTGIIESQQDGVWYSTGQSIYREYIVDRKYFPFKRLRFPKVSEISIKL